MTDEPAPASSGTPTPCDTGCPPGCSGTHFDSPNVLLGVSGGTPTPGLPEGCAETAIWSSQYGLLYGGTHVEHFAGGRTPVEIMPEGSRALLASTLLRAETAEGRVRELEVDQDNWRKAMRYVYGCLGDKDPIALDGVDAGEKILKLRAMLETIANRGCEKFRGQTGCFQQGMTASARYGADMACAPCCARDALNGGDE